MEPFETDPTYHQTEPSADIRKYLWLLWRWSWLILLCALLAAVGAYVFSRMQTPVYQASTTILVNEASSSQATNYSAIYLTNSQLTNTYAAMLTKQPLIDKVKERLVLNQDSADFEVSIVQISNTQLLQVLVESVDPYLAANVANELVAVFTEQIKGLQESKYSSSKDNLQTQLQYLEEQIEENSKSLDSMIQANVQKLQSQTGGTDAQGEPLPTEAIEEQARQMSQPEIDQIETRLTQYRQIYASVLASYEQVRLAEAQGTTSFIQVEPAVPPEEPIRPQVTRTTLLAAVVGLMLAIGVIFMIEYLDDTIRDPEAVAALTGLPVLGAISHHDPEEGDPTTQNNPRSPVAEAFRALRTNVKYASVDRPLRRILVTSPTPEDGKTTVASNLAIVLAQGGSLVTLVDADLRRPRIHRNFGLDNKLGLTALFVQPHLSAANTAHAVKTETLKIITSGGTPPNPSELLGSQKMNNILAELEHSTDMIILDTPPVLTVTDAVALSSAVDGVLLVAKLGQTREAALLKAVEQLRQVNANILGLVINDINRRSTRYYYYYRDYYYDNYTEYYGDSSARKHSGKNPNGRKEGAHPKQPGAAPHGHV